MLVQRERKDSHVGPSAKANETKTVDIDTRRAHGFSLRMLKTARKRKKLKIELNMFSSTRSIEVELPTDARRYRSLL
jgi:hypothetical protein